MLPQKRPMKEVVMEHLWGPTGSFVFHVLLAVALIKFVTFQQRGVVETVQIKRIEAKDIDIPPPEKMEIQELKDLDFSDDLTFDGPSLDVDIPTESEVTDTSNEAVDLTDLEVMSNIDSPVVMHGIMQGRTAAGRERLLAQFGGNPATERAVLRALEFLKSVQKPNGSWDDSVGITGLGLLTFLAHGETPSSEKFGPVVEKAIKYLMGSIQSNGRFKAEGGHAYVYHHAIAAYGLAEAFGMTRIPALKPEVEKVMRVIIDNQMPGGGWSYSYDKNSDRNDSSVAAWQIQALKAASIAGMRIEGLSESLNKSLLGLQELYIPTSGNFGYSTQNKRSNIGLTGLGVLCFQLVGKSHDPITQNGLKALADTTANWGPQGGWPLYAWYYVTQAKFHQGGDPWKRWNATLAPALVKNQNEDGSWVSPGNSEAERGKVYSTTFAALSLQVYYRFLPTFQEKALTMPGPTVAKDDVEIDIEI